MKPGFLSLLLTCLATPVWSGEWQFSHAIPVTSTDKPGVFYHIDSSGRKNIAVSATTVAVVWEDNRSGASNIYVAFKALTAARFSTARQVSTHSDAYEPSLVSLDEGNFIIAWEQAGTIWVRSVTATTLSKPVQLDTQPSTQVTLTSTATGTLYAAWAQKHGKFSRIVTSRLTLQNNQLRAAPPVVVDTTPVTQDQLYPSLAIARTGVVAAWEDRRDHHTRLFSSVSTDGKQFAPIKPLNEFQPPQNPKYGRGTGVTRVALAAANQTVAATWMDKREFLGGYDIYASVSEDGGKTFGKNELVEDSGMESLPQWHPAIAIDPKGLITVAWDDNRYDSPDIWLSWRNPAGSWSEDVSPAPASGEGEQTNPAIAFDQQGQLHLIWISKTDGHDPTLMYATGTRSNKP